MLVYWIMFLLIAMAAINAPPSRGVNAKGMPQVRLGPPWLGVFVLIIVVIGFRFEVGGDWSTYFNYLEQARWLTFAGLVAVADPGYMVLNIISSNLGWGITGVNVMGATIFGASLAVFLRSLPRPWLGLACALPYLIIVVSMGYTRQGIALGLVMVGFAALRRAKFIRFSIWVVLGALFHKSAVLVIPIAILTTKRQRLQAFGFVGLISYASYDAFLAQHAARIVDVYINQQLAQSQGAFIRLAMNSVPAALFLVYQKRFVMSEIEYRLWWLMSVIALVMFAALLGTGFTTALDRMALYLIPLQLVVFAHLPEALGHPNRNASSIVGAILLYYAAVLFVWLKFAIHSQYWQPYQMGLSLN